MLRDAGVPVTAVAEVMRSASDRQVLAHAHSNRLWVLTMDRDYGELVFARAVPPPPAIIYLRQGLITPAEMGANVVTLLANSEFILGHLVVVRGRSMRRRALPVDG